MMTTVEMIDRLAKPRGHDFWIFNSQYHPSARYRVTLKIELKETKDMWEGHGESNDLGEAVEILYDKYQTLIGAMPTFNVNKTIEYHDADGKEQPF